MKRIYKINISIVLLLVAMIFMSFIPFAKKDINTNKTNKINITAANLWVGWKTVDVTYRTSGNYIVKYADLVSLDPGHSITWGCGYLDIDKLTAGFQCSVTRDYYTATGANSCEYIYVHSLATPLPGETVVNTIDVRVMDDQGVISNWGGITLNIHNNGNPDNSEPVNPCLHY